MVTLLLVQTLPRPFKELLHPATVPCTGGELGDAQKYQSSLLLLLYSEVVLARESEAGEELLKQASCLNRTV